MGHPKDRQKSALVFVSRPDGEVVGGDSEARRRFGAPDGAACWNRIGKLEGAEGLPCFEGCTARLIAAGRDQSAHIRIKGQPYELSCVPVNGKVVSVLARGVPEDDTNECIQLTAREQEVLQLLVEGLNSPQIAIRLGIGSGTVRTHVEHLRAKLDAPTRAAIVGRAFRLGYVR